MIHDFPKLWAFLTYDGLKSHVNVTEAHEQFVEDRIRVGQEEAGTSALKQTYDKFQEKQNKLQTRQLLEFSRWKVPGWINQWQLIMIISTATQNITAKVWAYYFVAVNLHPDHHMTFHDWIRKISPAVKTGETAYFLKHKGSYYDAMPSVWKKMSAPVRREIMCIIERFVEEAPPGKSPWTRENVLSLIHFFSLEK